jgi:hypothetical protein
VSLETLEDVDDALKGAVIERLDASGVDGFSIYLQDGRILIIPDAVIIAVISRGKTH